MGNLIVWRDIWQGPSFLVVFFDIGQGDSIFMRSPWGHTILIDGGPDTQVEEKIGKLLLPWAKHIDLVVLSHPDKDHVFGLIGVLKRFKVDTLYWTGVRRNTREYMAWEQQLAGQNIVLARAPQQISWTQNQSQYLDILSPVQDYAGKLMDLSNESGIVARLVLPRHSVLLTADIPKLTELELVESGVLLASDILKVAHHGSKNSSAPAFLQAVHPEVAVISSGKDNTYGHPHQETLAKLEQYGIQIRRTDQEGDIRFYLR
ncbi:MAG: MBL fold metallo-hydrolase [bacterium]|nr:MBL fold metallo-hydrolase [bacterium]